MALHDDLVAEAAKIFSDVWKRRNGTKVPESKDLGLGNDAVLLDATVLYADLADSTALVDSRDAYFAAEIYKAYLHCAAKVIRSSGGTITSYDGDRVMGVFIGDSKNSSAAKCGLKLNYLTTKIVNPALASQYPGQKYTVRQTVGIDTSSLFVARTGIRGSNDLVWVGRAANYAAKLTKLSSDYPTWITGDVFNRLNDEAQLSKGKAMWESRSWTAMDKLSIYRSNWTWKI